jgi:phage-related protein
MPRTPAPINGRMRVASLPLAVCPSLGYELRRPLADILRNGIYELRIRKGRVNYRILYFFHGRNLAILGHALTKEDKVPKADIERAIRRKKAFEENPAQHSYSEEE